MNDGELTGQARTHVVSVVDPDCLLHAQAVTPFLNLRRAAQASGIDLVPWSGFRDFARQLNIWNGKFSGAKPMFDASGARLDAAALAPLERINAILLWSALPGASRHHWGTDVDLVDRNATPPGYQVKLTPEEFAHGRAFRAARAVVGDPRRALRVFSSFSRSQVRRSSRTLAFQLCPDRREGAAQLKSQGVA